ncbi:MAG: DUF3048 domain-containing protein [Candidatus Saccharibacteria bacterium]|nr:DUF3048 domain-containing protein [Candidatus Saccharibacteria bacterium]
MRTPTHRSRRLSQWLHAHHVSIALIAGALVVAGVFIVAISSLQSSPDHAGIFTPKPKPKPKEKHYSLLTGQEIADVNDATKPVTGVMIENSPAARPQSGLSKAGVVYEAVAEGGITRFLALYQGDKPALIGPVRSLRLYYLSWAAPYQASIAHVGGSDNALATVRNGTYRDIDEFFHGGFYWRARDRYAPHNVYTSGEKLDQLQSQKGYTNSSFTSFPRQDGKPSDTPTATTVRLNFSGATYNTHYTYDKDSNSYRRFLAGQPHNDREAGQLSPAVVVALESQAILRPNSGGYEDIVTTSSGKATVFQNGTATAATWRKANFDAPLELIDANGKPLALNRGQTWIGAYTPGRGSVLWE